MQYQARTASTHTILLKCFLHVHYQQQVKHALFPSESFRNEARLQYNRGFVLVCCRSHQMMGLEERREEKGERREERRQW